MTHARRPLACRVLRSFEESVARGAHDEPAPPRPLPDRLKRCSTCDESKPLEAKYWHRKAGSSDGYCSRCKACRNAIQNAKLKEPWQVERRRNWNRSKKGKAYRRNYQKVNGPRYTLKYRASAKGKATMAAYQASTHGKATKKASDYRGRRVRVLRGMPLSIYLVMLQVGVLISFADQPFGPSPDLDLKPKARARLEDLARAVIRARTATVLAESREQYRLKPFAPCLEYLIAEAVARGRSFERFKEEWG